MKASWFATVASALPLFLGACTSPTEGDVDLSAQSDKSIYHLATDRAAQPLLINRGVVAVYLPMNEYVAVQRLSSGRWQDPQPWFAVDGTSISFRLEPGDTLRAFAMDFAYVANSPGTYRFRFEVAHDPNGRTLVAESERVSAPFELRP